MKIEHFKWSFWDRLPWRRARETQDPSEKSFKVNILLVTQM